MTSSLLVLGFRLEAAAAAATPAMEAGQGLSAEMEEIVAGGSVLMVLSNYVFAAVFFVVFGLWLRHQRRVIPDELAEEMDVGLISPEEWKLAPRYWYRLLLY